MAEQTGGFLVEISPQANLNPTEQVALINDALTAGGTVRLGAGTWTINQPIVLPSYSALVGAGHSQSYQKTIIKPAAGYSGLLLHSQGLNVECIFGAHVEGIHFDGSDTTLTAIKVNARECTFYKLKVTGCWTYGIQILGINGNAETGLALNNSFSDIRMAGGGSAKMWVCMMEDYYTADNRYHHLYLEDSQNALITSRGANCYISFSHFYNSDKHCVIFEDSPEKVLCNSYLENSDGPAVVFKGTGVQDISLVANIFRDIRRKTLVELTEPNGGPDCVVWAQSLVQNCILSDNLVRRSSADKRTVGHFIVGGNVVDNGNSSVPGALANTNSGSVGLATRHITASTKLTPNSFNVVTATGVIQLSLPDDAPVGSIIWTVFGTSVTGVTLMANGNTINGSASNFSMASYDQYRTCFLCEATKAWRRIFAS